MQASRKIGGKVAASAATRRARKTKSQPRHVEAAATVEELVARLPQPPVCPRRLHTVTAHGDSREDPYFWLRDVKTSPEISKEVKKYLQAENKYTAKFFQAATGDLKQELFTEMKRRWKETDTSLPSKDRDYWYFSRSVEGKDHHMYCRVAYKGHESLLYDYVEALKLDPDADMPALPDEEVMIDMNEVIKRERVPNAELGEFDISPDQRHIVYSLDLSNGAEEYTIVVGELCGPKKDAATAAREIKRIDAFTNGAEVVWGTDDVIYYFILDETQRASGLVRHSLNARGTDDDPADTVIFEEDDSTFSLTGLAKSDDELYLTFYTEGKTSTEAHVLLKADASRGTWQPLIPRRPHLEYAVGHHSAFLPGADGAPPRPCWVVVGSMDHAENFRADIIPDDGAGYSAAYERRIPFIAYNENIKIEAVEMCEHFVVVIARIDTITRVFWQSVTVLQSKIGEGLREAAAGVAGAAGKDNVGGSATWRGLTLRSDFHCMLDLFRAAWNAGHLRLPIGGGRGSRASAPPADDDDGRDGEAAECYFDLSHFEADASENFHSTKFRVAVSSFTVPSQEFEVDLAAVAEFLEANPGAFASTSTTIGEAAIPRLLKQDPVRGRYDPSEYGVAQVWAEATETAHGFDPVAGGEDERPPIVTPDSRGVVRVPITLTYRRDMLRRGENPLVLYSYGSYGDVTDPEYASERLTLLDRGVIVALAAVRGGGELGRLWRNSGRMEHRINSITDFCACARALVDKRWCAPGMIVARGGSAGGTVVAGAALREPSLFVGVSAAVPFVDCLTTLLDPSIPLTTAEWDEWGNCVESREYFLVTS